MAKLLLPLLSVILSILFLLSLILFAVFPMNNVDIKNHTVQTTVENISFNNFYNSNELHMYTSIDFELPYRAIFVGVPVEFEYSNLNTSLDFFNRSAKTTVYLIYDISEQIDEEIFNTIFNDSTYHMRETILSSYLTQKTVQLSMYNFYKGYLLPVYFMDTLLTNTVFNFKQYFEYNGELPNLTPVQYFPIIALYYTELNYENVPVPKFSYSVPLEGWGYAGFDVGVRSYMGNIVTVFDFTLSNLNSLFNITNMNDVENIYDILELVKDFVLFPIHIVEMGYSLVTAFTFNLVFI